MSMWGTYPAGWTPGPFDLGWTTAKKGMPKGFLFVNRFTSVTRPQLNARREESLPHAGEPRVNDVRYTKGKKKCGSKAYHVVGTRHGWAHKPTPRLSQHVKQRPLNALFPGQTTTLPRYIRRSSTLTHRKMSGASRPAAASSTNAQTGTAEKSFFEQQRELLLKEIGVVCSVNFGYRSRLETGTDCN
jgi:hypothetical protein